ncbi:hypothetical protein V6N13_062065 [Hibiscus sabdariffa]
MVPFNDGNGNVELWIRFGENGRVDDVLALMMVNGWGLENREREGGKSTLAGEVDVLGSYPNSQLPCRYKNHDLSCRRYRNLFAIDFLLQEQGKIFYIKPFDVSTWWYLGSSCNCNARWKLLSPNGVR